MNCYNHQNEIAVANCKKCGKALCRECANKYTPILCDSCFEELQKIKSLEAQDLFKQTRRSFWRKIFHGILIIFVSFFVITFIVILCGKDEEPFAMTCVFHVPLLCFFSPFGWIPSHKSDAEIISDTITLRTADPIEGWLMFFFNFAKFLVKIVISVLIGIPKFFISIWNLKKMKKSLK